MCDSVNHTHFTKEDHLPDWVCRDKHSNRGDRIEYESRNIHIQTQVYSFISNPPKDVLQNLRMRMHINTMHAHVSSDPHFLLI